MTALVLALVVALAPEPKLSDADDFNEMVSNAEKETGCEAHRLMRAEPDDARVVLLHCPDGTSAVLVFFLRPIGDWVVVPRLFKCTPSKVEALGI